jgi:hypothetical protein
MSDERFKGWAILELMGGHRRLAGYVQEVELAGHGMLRVDVPRHPEAVCTCGSDQSESLSHEHHLHHCLLFSDDEAAPVDVEATQFYPPSALYCLTPTTESTARMIAKLVSRWDATRAYELSRPVDEADVL